MLKTDKEKILEKNLKTLLIMQGQKFIGGGSMEKQIHPG